MTDTTKHRTPLHDIGDLDPEGLPSSRSLVKATLLAIVIAAIVLVLAVLPAEYGIDPTGLGRKMGLGALHEAEVASQTVTAETVARADTALQSKTLTLPLMPGQGLEIKAVMKTGQSFVFDWSAEGGPVHVDMHGNVADAAEDDFTSYWIEDALTGGRGTFRAPFDGHHGWYWKNNGSETVTIKLQVSGFYDEIYMP